MNSIFDAYRGYQACWAWCSNDRAHVLFYGRHAPQFGSDSIRVEDDVIFFYVKTPSTVSYVYRALMAKNFGGVLTSRYDEVDLIPSEPSDGCQPITNGILLHGQVALVKRGVCSFAEKSWRAQEAGAMAVMIYDSDESNDHRWIDMVRDGDAFDVVIPSMFVLGKEGWRIARGIQEAGVLGATIKIPVNESHISVYDYYPGTLW